jgi:hypothetical protein
VPEAAVNKHGDLAAWENNVGPDVYPGSVNQQVLPKAEAAAMER